jgi:purine-binding chemotaxis protein CheW
MAADHPAPAGNADDLLAELFEDPATEPAAVPPVTAAATTADAGHQVPPGATLAEVLVDLAAWSSDCGSAPAVSAVPARRAERLVLFMAGGTTYGVRVPEIVEVGRIPSITPVPRMPAWVRGVTNLRGDVVSVIDLAAFCGMEPTPLTTGRLLVARATDEDLTIGILVDRVLEIAAKAAGDLRQPAAPLEGTLTPFLRGIYERDSEVVAVLDVAALLKSSELRQFEDTTAA